MGMFRNCLRLDSSFYLSEWLILSIFFVEIRYFNHLEICGKERGRFPFARKYFSVFEVVFVPLWISLCIALLFVISKLILAIIHHCSRRLITHHRETSTILEAILYALMFIPFSLFAVWKEWESELDRVFFFHLRFYSLIGSIKMTTYPPERSPTL